MKPNKEQVAQLKALAKHHKVDMADVKILYDEVSGMKQIVNSKEDDEAKAKTILRVVRSKMMNKTDKESFGGTPKDVVIRVEIKEEPTEFKRKDGETGYRSAVYCTANAGGDDYFAVLTLWNDANEVNPQLAVGETYATKAIIKDNQLTMNKAEAIKSITDKLLPMSKVIVDSYPVIGLDDLDSNISDDWNDLKLMKGVIVNSWSTETKNGNMMGFLKLMDDKTDDVMVAKFSKMYEQVNLWDEGSLVYVLGQVTPTVYDEDSGEIVYDASSWGNLIVPINAFEKVVEESDDKDDVDDDFEDEDFEDFDFDDDGDTKEDVEEVEEVEEVEIDDDEDEDWG